MSLRLEGTISGWGRSAGAVIPARGSGRYSPGPNIVLPSWLQGSDPHCTLNVCWGQPGALATVSKFLKCEGNILFIDLPEYYIERVGKILGSLLTMVGYHSGV